jgi:general secretion pathway protein M
MSAVLSELGSRWTALPERTRLLAIIAGTLVIVMLLYSSFWRPLQRDLANLRTTVPTQTEQLEWMRAQEPAAKALRGKSVATGGNIMQTVEQTATTQNIRSFITRMDAEGNGGVRVTLEAVPFNGMVSWLSEIQMNYGVTVDDARIESRPTAGVVNAQLRLRTGGA